MQTTKRHTEIPGRAVVLLLAALAVSFGTSALDKSGVQPGAISLPSGPGSIEGLGESFQPTLNTGTAKYGVPLSVPAGTAGMAPRISLRYDGGGANGPLGFGWTLAVPWVGRQTDKGVPRYVDAPNSQDDDHDGDVDESDELDTFINDAGEELIPQANGDYFCENEGAFIRYRRIGGGWEGVYPNGTRMEFGLDADAQVQDEEGARTCRWLLEQMTDTNGNAIVFFYATFSGDENTGSKYLSEIAYGPGAPPWDNFHFLRFAYEDRSDWFEDCRSGFPIRTGKRLASVTIATQGPTLEGHAQGDYNGDGLDDNLLRIYELDYEAHGHWSLLTRVTLVGADGATSLPPAVFDYTVCDPADTLSATEHVIGGDNEPFQVMDNDLVDLVDLNGDALPDILKTDAGGGSHTAYLNQGETGALDDWEMSWSSSTEVASADGLAWTVDLQSTSKVAYLADMDGDGLSDLVYKPALGDLYYFPNTGALSWDMRRLMSVQDAVPPAPFASADVKSADVDFDKRMDVIQSIDSGTGADYRIWFNLGDQQFSSSITVGDAQGYLFSQPGVDIADFNGDRVPDITRRRTTGVDVTPGLGYGVFGDAITVAIPDLVLTNDQVDKARLHDVTGDGLADLVIERAAPGQLWYWVNLGNYSFDTQRTVTGMPSAAGVSPATRWADINGNGTTDLVYADSANLPRIQSVDIGRLMGCVPRPNLLVRMENGIGRVTTIEYAASTAFALQDAEAGTPWPDPMPFPLSVVSSFTLEDSMGNSYTTEFIYHDGYYDGAEKEFRGFGRVEQISDGDETAPALVTRHDFDTGRDNKSMKGKLLRQSAGAGDVKVGDDLLFWEETTTWDQRVLMTGANGIDVVYAHPTAKERRVIERGQGEERLLEFEYSYDDYGNQTANREYGIVEGGGRGAGGDERIVVTEFAYDIEDWQVRFPIRQELQDLSGTVVTRSETYYDDPTFAGDNIGQVEAGNVTLVREWTDPAAAAAYIAVRRTQYDAYGNPAAIIDPLASVPAGVPDPSGGHYREIAYDGYFHAFPTTETIQIGSGSDPLVVQAVYDVGLGTITSSTDFNGHVTSYGYDVFGRLTETIRPGDSTEYPTLEYSYVLAEPFGNGQLVNYIETRRLDREAGSMGPSKRDHYLIARSFVDGLGRELMAKAEAESGPGSGEARVVVTGAAQFNARRSVSTALQPFYSLLPGTGLDALLEFEDLGAPGWQGSFHEDGALVALDLDNAHRLRKRYDATLREVEATNPDGTVRKKRYEPLQVHLYDEDDADPQSPHHDTPLIHHLDGLGRLVQVDEVVRLKNDGTPAAALKTWSTHYSYRSDTVLLRITDAQGNQKHMSYDGLGRKLVMDDPDRGLLSCTYDDASNLLSTIDAKGQQIDYTYDGINRLLTEDYDDAGLPFSHNRSPDVAYHYDVSAGEVDFGNGTSGTAQNTKGFPSYIVDLSGEEHNSYDERGRVVWAAKRVPDPLSGEMVSYTSLASFDSFDRIVDLTYPDGDSCTYEYNERGLAERIAGGAPLNAGGTDFILSAVDYAPSGQLLQSVCGNGVTTDYRYDARARMAGLTTAHGDAPAEPLIDYAYTFNSASGIAQIDDLRPATERPEGDPRRNTQIFEYDDLYRLTRAQFSFNAPGQPVRDDGQIDYRYDRIGNMLAKTSTLDSVEEGLSTTHLGAISYGGALGAWDRDGRSTADAGPHALTSVDDGLHTRAYAYDANGNMTDIDGLACTWDFKDRVAAVEDGSMRAEYSYDYAGRRVAKSVWKRDARGELDTVASTTTVYVDKYYEIREYDQPTKYVYLGDRRVARITGRLQEADQRRQNIRVAAGWNLLSLAVDAADAADQLGLGSDNNIEAIFLLDEDGAYLPLADGGAIPQGAVFWLLAGDAALLSVTGDYSGPVSAPIDAGKGYAAPGLLEAVHTDTALPATLEGAMLFNSGAQSWSQWLPGAPGFLGDSPEFIRPGEAVFVDAPNAGELALPGATQRIVYYHQDHVTSSTLVTDGEGNIVDETVFYPFGQPRRHYRPAAASGIQTNKYAFAQKEQDAESGLHYFHARYLAAPLGAFTSVDPVSTASPERFLAYPQGLNPYGYALRNPLSFRDPTGESWSGLVGGFVDQAKGLGMYSAMSLATGQSPDIPWADLGMNAASQVLKESEASLQKLKKKGTGQRIGAVAGLIGVRSAEKILAEGGEGDWGQAILSSAVGTVLGEVAAELGIEDVFKADSAADAVKALSNVGRNAAKKLVKEISGSIAGAMGGSQVGQVIGTLLSKAFEKVMDKVLDKAFEALDKVLGNVMDSEVGDVMEDAFQMTKQEMATGE